MISRPRHAFLVAVLAVAACMAGRPLPVATPSDVTRGSQRYPDLTAQDLTAGRKLYASRCAGCHTAPAPSSQRPEDWPAEVHEMKERAHLSDEEIRLIERYVVTMSDAPLTSRRD